MATDKDFNDRIIKGDRKAFDELFKLQYTRLCSFACSYLKDFAMAENIVQDAFLLLWERHSTLLPDSNLAAWLLVVVRNNTLNYINRLKRQEEAEQAYATQLARDFDLRLASLKVCDPDEMYGAEVERIIRETIDALPEQCRLAVTLSRFEEMSNQEIADRLGITSKGVEYHITNGLKKLRRALKDYLMFLLLFAGN
ncbi:MAG: RNA polymerase sigma-70 factor [Tannerella sp.]|jgi:RNA polymerase sigma-70 factor (ECF subfamily)|nr:RNA polymerase sigma-70 factor [Tannerella sp.]